MGVTFVVTGYLTQMDKDAKEKRILYAGQSALIAFDYIDNWNESRNHNWYL